VTSDRDLAGLILPTSATSSSGTARQPELGFHQGVVVSWNSSTNENELLVAGSTMVDVPALSTADSVLLRPGDVVGLLRFRTTYFMLGRIALPGVSDAVGLQIAEVGTPESTSSATPTDLATVGPQVTDVYVGSSRRVIVFATALTSTGSNNSAAFSVEVSGATSIDQVATALLTTNTASVIQASIGTFDVANASHYGINEGFHNFKMEYSVIGGGSATFAARRLIVMPF
jgi:hypothetical protein